MNDLKQQIIDVLSESETALKAKKIAKLLGEDNTARINSILYAYNKEFTINDKYEWSYMGGNEDSEIRENELSNGVLLNKDRKTFHYYNCNPKARFTDDCVVRAVCTITNIPWDVAMIELAQSAIETGYMLNTPENYGEYLEMRGYKRHKQPVHSDGTKMRFNEFVAKFGGRAVVHCGKGHVTYVENHSTWDVWDVSNEIVGCYWSKD